MTLNHNYDCSNEAVTGIAGNYPIAAILRDILSQISATFATGLYQTVLYQMVICTAIFRTFRSYVQCMV